MRWSVLAQQLLTLFSRRQSIRRSLMIVMTVALVPLAMLSTVQGITRFQREEAASRAELASAVAIMAHKDRNPAARADSLLELFQRIPTVRTGPATPCVWLMEAVAPNLPPDMLLLRAGPNGRIDCTTDPHWLGRTIPAAGLSSDSGPADEGSPPSPLLVRRHSDAEGAAAAVVRLDRLELTARSGRTGQSDNWLLTDGTGRILHSHGPAHMDRINVSVPAATAIELTDTVGGRSWTYAQVLLTGVPGTPGAIHFVRVRPGIAPLSMEWWFNVTFLALPLLALLLATAAIWIGTNHSILRWISSLRDLTSGIAEGHYRQTAVRFDDAPTEIRTLASDIQRMARTIAERDRTLTEALERQTALALELNHRVRNNLQLIASYLTLEAARVGDGVAARPITQVRLRVSALALVHRLLYAQSEQPHVPADRLLKALAELLADSFGLPPISVAATDTPIGIDSAVPMVMWLIEAMAWRGYGHAADAPGEGHIGFRLDNGEALLLLRLSQATRPTGTGAQPPRLLGALAHQLGGAIRVLDTHGGGCELLLCIPQANLHREFHANIGNNR